MKKINYLLIFLISYFTVAQEQTFTINWNGFRVLSTSNSSVEVPSFSISNFNFSHEEGITFVAQWNINSLIDESSAKLINIQYETISELDLKDLKVKTIPNKLKFSISNAIDRNKKSGFIKVYPIINQNGIFKRIIKFTVSYNSKSLNRTSFSSQSISNSVLSQGEWYKFYVDTTGVFKLSRNFLNSLGVNTNNVDPKTIKIFGQGGKMLPMLNSAEYPIDLKENAIKFIGEEDGVFNNNDYILFYAIGPKGYQEASNTNINPYTDKSYYFVNVSSGLGKRINPQVQPELEATFEIDKYQDYMYHEKDEYNLAQVGRRWFGDRFYFENEKTFSFDIPNIDTSQPVNLKVFVAATAETQTSMQLTVNGNLLDTFVFQEIDSPILGDDDTFIGNITVNSSEINVNLNYDNNGSPSSAGYLDFISIEATRGLTYTNGQFTFKNNDVALLSGIGQYNIGNASLITEVWDITDHYNITSIENTNNASIFSFKAQLGEERMYHALDDSDYFEPKKNSNSRVNNQNIKGTVFLDNQGNFHDIDYLIITSSEMLSQAQRLAQINRDINDLSVKVYTLQDIYNEFSSGNQDISGIRNFIRYVYNNASTPENRIKYLCLFGDASFDYKDRINNNTNIVPSWHSYSSFNLSNAYVSDDFFVQLDTNEGGMTSSDKLDLAVGRIIADSPQRAKELVDKIETYYSEAARGSWKNNYVVISDDVDESWEKIIQNTTNEIADVVTQNKPFLNPIKIHSDSYVQQSTPGGERYPAVNKAILDAIEVGALVVNYFGHGGEDGISSERIFDKINAQELKNGCKLNCFVTVTCEYTKFDNPLRPTAGEYTYWNNEGGAISLITTTRQIFVSVGVVFNVVLEEYLFAFNSNDYPSMAEALRLTKNDNSVSGIDQKRLVFYIGDPAMKPAFAKPNVRLTQINDVPIDQETDVLEALSSVKISGEVTDESGNILDNFNGVVTSTIFDKEIQRSTLANDNTQENGQTIVLDFNTLGEIIFRGQASVTNGQFEFDFVVPKDIGIPVGNGKINFYANSTDNSRDFAGSSFDIKIGGINENAPVDNEGPQISLYMNDENFVSGGITNEEPTLVAKLFDENGINTASGIGHDIIAIIDNDETNPFKLNDYYIADVDNHQSGSLKYPLRDLEPGLHTLTLKAWDVYNNSSLQEIQFVVYDQDEELIIKNVLNYPNPFINYTEFWFNHNSSDVLDVSIQIFTVSGKLVKTLNTQTNANDMCCGNSALSKDIVWDGRDDFGEKIGKGVYVYKLKVKSEKLNKQVEKIQKLVIL
ncbi:MAG: type IX secretion system sortase PorU [Flavobacteriaceae bacterium]|nr:type IX secretion system sortase PorU [Flavobacteriaceae bacterium]